MYSLWYFIPAALCSVLLALVSVWASLTAFAILVAVPAAFLAYWIPRFYRSVTFRLERDHAYARYGVWWVKEKRVPYNLVSEVRLRQGPLQRSWGLACVDVFTPATGVQRPELTFFQLDANEASRVASELRARVGILTSRERRVLEEEMLAELKAIRELLESVLRRSQG